MTLAQSRRRSTHRATALGALLVLLTSALVIQFSQHSIASPWSSSSAALLPPFAIGQLVGSPTGPHSVQTADLDGDHDRDIVHAGVGGVAYQVNLGNGIFGPQQVVENGLGFARRVALADIDGDSDVDIVAAFFDTDTVAWYANDGSGSFGPAHVLPSSPNGPHSLRVVDLDGDGHLDILVISSDDDTVGWFKNLGLGVFGPRLVISTNADFHGDVEAADLDGDTDLDVISATGGDDKLAWYENLGGGSFGSQQVISLACDGAWEVRAADINGDGAPDLICASSQDNSISWFENLGGGTFGPRQVISSTIGVPAEFAVVDIDRDSDLDLAIVSVAGNSLYFIEASSSGFLPATPVGSPLTSPFGVAAADLNGDGYLDLITAAKIDNAVIWYENLSFSPITINVPGDAPSIQAAIAAAFAGDTILVSPGTYFENIDFLGKDISVLSTAGRGSTTIDGGGVGRCVLFKDGANGAELRGFTITNGNAIDNGIGYSNYGGGIFCWNSSPVIADCRVTSCSADDSGGGIALFISSASVTGCIVDSNSAVGGGGGIVVKDSSSPTISSTLIAGNSSFESPGFLGIFGATPSLVNCTVANNLAATMTGGMVAQQSAVVSFTNGISHGNQPLDASTHQSGVIVANFSFGPASFDGTSNLSGDPLFIDAPSGDYRLSNASLCIDAGDGSALGLPSQDYLGSTRVVGTEVDIGAAESLVTTLGGGQSNSSLARLEISGRDVGSTPGPFVSPVTRGHYFTFDLGGSPNSIYEMYGSSVLSPGGWNFGAFGVFDLGTGPSFNDVYIVLPGFQNSFPFYTLDATGESQLSFYVHPALTPGSVLKVQALMQLPPPWAPDPTSGIPVWGRLTAAHDLVVQ